MTKRPSIQAKLQQSKPAADSPQVTKIQPASAGTASMVQSRVGKVNISAYFPPEVKSSLRLVQAKRGGKIQDLLAEGAEYAFHQIRGAGGGTHRSGSDRRLDVSQTTLFRLAKSCLDSSVHNHIVSRFD